MISTILDLLLIAVLVAYPLVTLRLWYYKALVRWGHWTIGQILRLDPPPTKETDMMKPELIPPSSYTHTLVGYDGHSVVHPPIIAPHSFRHAHVCDVSADEYQVVLTDDPDGPTDPDGHVVASFDRIGSAVWTGDGTAGVVLIVRKEES